MKFASATRTVVDRAALTDPDPATAALLLAAGRGDHLAFADLYDRTCARIHGLVLETGCDRSLAEELTGRAYLQIWRACPSFDPREASAFGWMLSVLHQQQPVPCP